MQDDIKNYEIDEDEQEIDEEQQEFYESLTDEEKEYVDSLPKNKQETYINLAMEYHDYQQVLCSHRHDLLTQEEKKFFEITSCFFQEKNWFDMEGMETVYTSVWKNFINSGCRPKLTFNQVKNVWKYYYPYFDEAIIDEEIEMVNMMRLFDKKNFSSDEKELDKIIASRFPYELLVKNMPL